MKTGLYDWIHPEERDAFERDYQNFLTGRTLFGTVTRYVSLNQSNEQIMILRTNQMSVWKSGPLTQGTWRQSRRLASACICVE